MMEKILTLSSVPQSHYKGGNFEYHLIPFKAAFDANVSSVMPYYSLPLGITSEDVGGSYNKEIITGLLKGSVLMELSVQTENYVM